ncbi:MFS transporter [Actinopolymorpha pittospori]|uniref:MFS family permease n=1 Tax=Actinopolymorpha pittospori TaxID=648752 RepID=A0A927N2Q8_9ACTN|nr:MFS family permease [Actinopolymorpha pittospori]
MSDGTRQPVATAASREATLQLPRGRVLAVLLSATFMGQFDFFVVNVAAPSLRQALGAGDAALELIVGGYAFAYAAALISGGRLGDLLGHRRVFVTGMLAFAVTSLLCGLATSPGTLVAARLAQGLAAAAMLPQVLALITATFPPAERSRALAWYGVAGGVGSVAGQVLGGLLVSSDLGGLGWRLIFLVNVPVGLVAALLARRMLPAGGARSRAAVDPLGALGIAVTLALVLVPLTLGRTAGWPLWTWLSMALAVPVGVVTIRWQHHLHRRGGTPVLDLTLVREPAFRAGLVANGAFMLYFASFMFTLTLLLQAGLRLTPFTAGLAFAPAGIAFASSALAARPLLHRYGTRVMLAGCALIITGLALLTAFMLGTGPTTSAVWVSVCAAIASLGNGLVLPSLIGAALTKVQAHHAGAAAGVLTTAQQFASAAGVALLGTVFLATTDAHPGTTGYSAGMVRSAALDIALVLAVALSVHLIRRVNRAER